MQRHVLVLGVAFALTSRPAVAAFLECRHGAPTGDALVEWRQSAAQGLGDGSAIESTVEARIDHCFGDKIPACLQRLADYASRDDVAPPELDPAASLTPEKQPPAELFQPGQPPFHYVVPETIEQIAATHGWPAVRYKSRYAGGFDPETPSLLMIYVPGSRASPPVTYDRWLNIPLPPDTGADALTPTPQARLPSAADYAAETRGGAALPRMLTMVSLKRPHGDQPAAVYFQRFYRSVPGDPAFTPEPTADMSSCVSCHPNGVRAISPLGYHVGPGEAQLPPDAWRTVKAINDAMIDAAGDAVVSWRHSPGSATLDPQPFLVPTGRGPILGPAVPLNGRSRTQEFIMGEPGPDGLAGCYGYRPQINVVDIFGRAPGRKNVYTLSKNPQIRWEKVRDAMACEGCHDNETRGALNSSLDLTQIDFKILVDHSMPNGAHLDPMDQGSPTAPVKDDLTPDERMALANCLLAEFQLEKQQVAKWLTQDQCD